MKKVKRNVIRSIKIYRFINFNVLFKIFKCLSDFQKYYELSKIIYKIISSISLTSL
jgi:hypothetical protein